MHHANVSVTLMIENIIQIKIGTLINIDGSATTHV